jgi:Carboxypeptidase regulatory-like domain
MAIRWWLIRFRKTQKPMSFVLIVVLLVGACRVFAQEVSAGMTGKVTDPSGAAIVRASVVAKGRDRGTEWPTKTNEDGIYAFPRILVGTYELRVAGPHGGGSRPYVQRQS